MNLAEVTRLEVLRKAEEETHGWKLHIGGKWVDSASGSRYETIDPSFDTPVAAVPDGDAKDIDAAVAAAKAAFPAWSLELGGKNPLIVFPDVDIDNAAAAAVAGMNFTVSQGQPCGSNSRVFVHRDVRDRFMQAVADRIATIKVGLAEREDTQMGPVVTRAQYDRVMGYIESGKAQGARVVIGGKHCADPALARGYFIEPTVFDPTTFRRRCDSRTGSMPATSGSTAMAASASRVPRSAASRTVASVGSTRWTSS